MATSFIYDRRTRSVSRFLAAFRPAYFDTFQQTRADAACAYAEGIHGEADLFGELFPVVDFRVFFLLVVRDRQIAFRSGQLGQTFFKARVVPPFIFVRSSRA